MLQVELFVVADWRIDNFGRIVLFLGIMEFGQIWVFEDLVRSWPFFRIELKHLANEVNGIRRCIGLEPVFDVLDFELTNRADHRHRHLRIQRSYVFFARVASKRYYSFQLVQGGISWEHRLANKDLP